MTAQVTLRRGQVAMLPIRKVAPDPDQPRREFDEQPLTELAANIKERGVLQPLVVRRAGKRIVIKMGERRWRAAKLAGLKVVPCILDDAEQTIIERGLDQVAENKFREDLNPLELGEFLVRLREQEKKSLNEIAAVLAKHGMPQVSRPQISNYMRLVELPEWAKAFVRDGTFGEAHGRELLAGKDFPPVLEVAKKMIADRIKWSGSATVSDIKEAVRRGFREHGVDLEWHYGDDQRLFDIKPCYKCEFYRKVGNTKLCMNRKEFERKNAEARALQLLKEKGKADRKPTKRELVRAEKEKQSKRERTDHHGEFYLPKLAVCRAHIPQCYVSVDESGRIEYAEVERPHHRARHTVRRMAEGTLPRAGGWIPRRASAMVPIIPPELRPPHALSNYHILWEADWRPEPPVDPALLKHIGGDLYAVLATWNLTEVERAVLFGRR